MSVMTSRVDGRHLPADRAVTDTQLHTGRARMGVSKASVSMRITALEKAAGLPLVRRTTRAVHLTEAGQALVSSAGPAFERIGAGFTSVKDLTGEPRGTVRVTAPVALGRQHVAPALSLFLRKFPEITVHLALTDRFVNLAHEGFDLAIRHTSVAPDSYVGVAAVHHAVGAGGFAGLSPAPRHARASSGSGRPRLPALLGRQQQRYVVVHARRRR